MKDKIKQAWQFWSVRLGALLLAAPEALAFLRDNFADVAPYVPDILQPRLLQFLGLLIVILRVRRMVLPQ